jgi:hypothetical protein
LTQQFYLNDLSRFRGTLYYYDLETRKIIDNRYHIMQIIACSPDTPRFPPPYQEVDVFAIQDKIIESILGDVAQQEAAVIVNKPVSEEQTLVSQVLQGHLNNPGFDRRELRELRQFLKQPLVGASVQQLRKVLQTYSSTNDVRGMIETVRALYQHQGEFSSNGSGDTKPVSRIKREDLKLVCYEYIYA